MGQQIPTLLLVTVVAVSEAPAVWAGEATGSPAADCRAGQLGPDGEAPSGCIPAAAPASREPFRAGALSVEFMTGYFPRADVGPHASPEITPAVDYLPQALRVGLMCNDAPPAFTAPAGVCELLLEYQYAPIARTFGTYFTGPSALLRYNLVWPDSALVPYGQLGGGFVFTDAWKDPVQRVIGQEFEFLLRADAGVHIMLGPRWSLNLEGGFQHISNADLARRNEGLNSFGAAIGLTHYFGK